MPSNERPGRTVRLPVRLRPEEDAAVRERARACGMTLARNMRESALGVVPKARPGLVEMEAVRELARVGNNLNRLAHIANLNEEIEVEDDLRAVLEEVLAAARRLG